MKNNRNQGFTLIELLAVIVILGIIMLIAIPSITTVITNARKDSLKESVNRIADSLIKYKISNGIGEKKKFDLTTENELLEQKLKTNYGEAILYEDGSMTIYLHQYGFCASKGRGSDQVLISSLEQGNCNESTSNNLLINGEGKYQNNTNFSQFVYHPEDNSFSITNSKTAWYNPDTYIKVDKTKSYRISYEIKSSSIDTFHYVGITHYDIDKNQIQSGISEREGSRTKLARDLNTGDTKVYLETVSGFVDATNIYNASLYFWNYQDSTGYTWPEGIYTRYSWSNLWDLETGIDRGENTITLKSPWVKGFFAKGHSVSQGKDMGASNRYTSSGKIGTEWKKVEKVYDLKSSMMKNVVEYIKLCFNPNYDSLPNNTTWIRNIRIEEI